jgi:S-DNA-T family DNA segregation ATPase FtsK/SpoIIIE
LQPIVIIERGLPVSAWVLLARLAWRYRSEIAPALMASAVLSAGEWLHVAYPGWWPLLLAVSDLAAFALAVCGGHIGLTQPAERVYAATATLAVGGWLAAAMILGPLTSPMLPVLLVGLLIFAVPWWAHRRRRARARVQRALAAWPDIAWAIGLPGAKIQSARFDIWGWRARIKLAHGQTVSDLVVRIPAIESALGTYRGAVIVYSTADDKANWCELRVLDTRP